MISRIGQSFVSQQVDHIAVDSIVDRIAEILVGQKPARRVQQEIADVGSRIQIARELVVMADFLPVCSRNGAEIKLTGFKSDQF